MLTVEKYEVASVDRAEVLRYMGYAGQELADELDVRIDEVVARCLAVAQVIFDAAGTTAVERAADACEASIVAAAHERGLYTNFRFSPGYGDMPLSAQPVLLATLDAQRRLGITLSKSLLMTPTKSVTAVVGLFGEPQPSSHVRCADCLCRDFCRILRTGSPCWKR